MSKHEHESDDATFDAFLRGEDELSRRLKQLPQPAPSAELSAAILADAQAALRADRAVNDAVLPEREQTPRPAPHFLRRLRVPLALAASVLLATLAVLRMQGGSAPDQLPPLAQGPSSTVTMPGAPTAPPPQSRQQEAPAATAPSPSAPAAATNDPAPASATLQAAREQAARERAAREQAAQQQIAQQQVAREQTARQKSARQQTGDERRETPTMIAKADIPDAGGDIVLRSAPAPAPGPYAAPSMPPAAAPAPPAAKADSKEPKVWLALIEELLKADLKRDAQEEWQKFRKAYPKYPVADELARKFDAPSSGVAPESARQ